METGLKNYIKNMFAMGTTPTWDASYEGVLFYDKSSRKWVSGKRVSEDGIPEDRFREDRFLLDGLLEWPRCSIK